jgi:polysaccharide transporter, PST family
LVVHIWCGLFIGLGIARSSWLISENITKFQLFSMSIGAIVNIVLNVFLIKKYGGVGAAYATLISQILVSYLATIFVSRKIFRMQTMALLFNWKNLIHI